MTRYLVVLTAVMAGGFALLWVWAAAMPLAYLDPEYPVWRAKLALLQRCDLGDVLIVGDSRAAVDVMPALLPVKTTNLAVGGGMPIEAYVAVSRALTCPVPPRRVVISLDAAHFAVPDLFWERTVKYGFVGLADLALLRRLARETGDASLATPKRPDGLPAWLRGWLYAWRFPPLYFSSLAKGGGFLRLWPNRSAFAAAITARGQYFFGRDGGSSSVAIEGRLAVFVPLPVLDRYFDRLLALLAARGIPADFIAMPMNQATGRAVLPGVRTDFAAYLARFEARYPGFHVVGPAMPVWPDRYFGDEFSHLNPAGAALLSMRFGQCLQGRLEQASQADCVPAVVE
jgi:FAD/FMN-containing dehydrogenase